MTWEVEGIRQRGRQKRPGGIVLRMTWKVWTCPKRMCSPGINREGELRGQPANPGSPGKMSMVRISRYEYFDTVCCATGRVIMPVKRVNFDTLAVLIQIGAGC